jgi:fatty acid desaturase
MGLSSITDKQKEAAWRVEFKALGERLVFQNVKRGAIYNDKAKRLAALRWLSERDRTAQLAWLAFFAAIAGVLISIIGLLVATH